ncbi:MAG: FIST C-terminal domain-containing protein [Proteobacteria bacterium]|nr:FIST C-terminal domain-containing protein [Pseudomonadota bacterium]MBU1387494.1 FIST C-terminal domain-containing protein [Pseudomonadota bacterium]MBU1541919.1 FIST C-terminal domain-containing protein [Pseudomonadota bacterium]MBU2482415.1 FIST C-terminal domain-containing protein [Pseudomonadota bacterium]
MKHFSAAIQTVGELKPFLENKKIRTAEGSAKSILAQIFVSRFDDNDIHQVVELLNAFSEKVIVAGVSSGGEIFSGRALAYQTVVSMSFFESARLVPIMLKVPQGTEQKAGSILVEKLSSMTDQVKGLLLLTASVSINNGLLLQTIFKSIPGLPLFGGVAGDYLEFKRTLIFSNKGIFNEGALAIAMTGKELHLSRHIYCGWQPIGKKMTATKTDGLVLQEIDGRPAFDVYRKYFNINLDSNFQVDAIEFPLLLNRNGRLLARNPFAANTDGSIQFSADIQEGETLQFGYGNIDQIIDNSYRMVEKISSFAPQAIFIYSCAMRRFFMQQDVDREMAPLNEIAPTTGFFTYGEFCDLGNQSPHMNSTIVVVGIREGKADSAHMVSKAVRKESVPEDPYFNRPTSILSRLYYFSNAITEELKNTNAELQNKLKEIQTLRGILPICSSCKKIRDDKGYWNLLETYFKKQSDIDFSHGICPECSDKLYGEEDWYVKMKKDSENK